MEGRIPYDGAHPSGRPLSDNICCGLLLLQEVLQDPSPSGFRTHDRTKPLAVPISYPASGVAGDERIMLPATLLHQFAGLDAERHGELANRGRVCGAMTILEHGYRIVGDAAAFGQLPHGKRP